MCVYSGERVMRLPEWRLGGFQRSLSRAEGEFILLKNPEASRRLNGEKDSELDCHSRWQRRIETNQAEYKRHILLKT